MTLLLWNVPKWQNNSMTNQSRSPTTFPTTFPTPPLTNISNGLTIIFYVCEGGVGNVVGKIIGDPDSLL